MCIYSMYAHTNILYVHIITYDNMLHMRPSIQRSSQQQGPGDELSPEAIA